MLTCCHPNVYPRDIVWETTNSLIATVNNGTVSAIGAGECDIIASCFGKQAVCHIVVTDSSIEITLDQNEAQVLPNHIITLTPSSTADVLPTLAVSSSEPTVAVARVVNGRVQVVGIHEGTTTITVGLAEGNAIPATCLVTVYTEVGDLNCDGFINIKDLSLIIDYLLTNDPSQIKPANADVTSDSYVNIADVAALINLLLTAN